MLSAPTRMPNGLTNANTWQTMGNAGIPDPTWNHTFCDDFDTFAAGDWTDTVVGTGPVALASGDGGILSVATSAGATDAASLQPIQPSFAIKANKQLFFKFNFSMASLAGANFFAGMFAQSTTPLTATSAIYLVNADAAGHLNLVVKVPGQTTVTVPLPTVEAIVAATMVEVGITVDNFGTVRAFFNPTTADNPPSAAQTAAGASRGAVAVAPRAAAGLYAGALLAPTFGLVNTAAAIHTMLVDYIVASLER